jgi:ABC-type uncharacterized transport system permease subunit
MTALLAPLRLGLALAWRGRLELVVLGMSAALGLLLNSQLWLRVLTDHPGLLPGEADRRVGALALGWVLQAAFSTRVDELVLQRFRSGDVALELLRPGHWPLSLALRELARAACTLLAVGLPVLLVARLLLPISLLPQPGPALLLALSLAWLLRCCLGLLVGLIGAALHSPVGLGPLLSACLALGAGAVIPLELYPPSVAAALAWSPLPALAALPAAVALDQPPPPGAWKGALAAAIYLPLLVALLWRALCRRLEVAGG